ncbi:MAG: hypothetical protein J3K34DRAFT_82288 [Monoraphidium minutum]|nr:MAG: hypothetical protein J3K34DRAFT_82288 [Monoraphidium minutum]
MWQLQAMPGGLAPLAAARCRRAATRRGAPAAAAGRSGGVKARTPGAPIQELDLRKLYTDPTFVPNRLIGPVEVVVPAGKTRRVVAKREVPLGALLFVSEPVGSVARSDPGRALMPPDLLAHLSGQAMSDADRYKLAVLYDGTPASQQRPTSFKDFEAASAASKASKAKAATKGFGGGGGGGGSGGGSGGQQQQQQRVSVEITADRLDSIVTYNAWGSEISDIGAAPARGEKLSSFIGIWPEFSLLNHSCIPNTSATLIGDRLVVRAASTIPKGGQITTSYLDAKGGVPLAERRRALQVAYGFRCGCARCKLEEQLPEELRQLLEALNAAAMPGGGLFDGLVEAADTGDAAKLRAMLDAASAEHARLTAALDAAALPAGTLDRAAATAGAANFLMALQRTKMAAAAAAEAAAADGGSGDASGGDAAIIVEPTDLLDLVEVLRVYQPGGAPVLATAADALSYAASKYGPGSEQAKGALKLFLKMLMIKFGEVSERPVLERLVEAVTKSSARLAALGLDSGFALAAPGPAGGAS